MAGRRVSEAMLRPWWVVDLCPVNGVNRGGPDRPMVKMKPKLVVVHTTANYRPRMDAKAHRAFVHGGGGQEAVSFHLVADDRQVIQLLPFDERGFHAGDGSGPGNATGIGLELCVNSDGDFELTLQNAQRMCATLLVDVLKLKPTADALEKSIRRHQDFSGKECPRELLDDEEWASFLRGVATAAQVLTGSGEAIDDEQVVLERRWQAVKDLVGGKREYRQLRQPYYSGGVIICERGVITTNGTLPLGYVLDDWVTFHREHGTISPIIGG